MIEKGFKDSGDEKGQVCGMEIGKKVDLSEISSLLIN